MKIISPFKDYYDSTAQYGIDESVVYHRVPDVIEAVTHQDYSERGRFKMPLTRANVPMVSKIYNPQYRLKSDNVKVEHFDNFTVGVAGKLYNLILSVEYGLIRSAEEFYSYYTYKRRWFSLDSEDEIVKFFDSSHGSECFELYKTPVFAFGSLPTYSKQTLHINPNLSKLQFHKILTPYEAFVQIQDYISGVLGVNEYPIVQVSDKDMRDAKGFDDRSFKKLPTKKRG